MIGLPNRWERHRGFAGSQGERIGGGGGGRGYNKKHENDAQREGA